MSRIRFSMLALALSLGVAVPLAAQAPAALKFTELGKGPTVVLIAGLGGARLQWMPTTRRLMAHYRVVMVDLPGHGDSPMPDPFSFDVAAAQLNDLLSRQKAESTVVVGHGLGGVIAVLAAKQHPEYVRGVAVVDAGLKSPFADIPDQQRKFFLDFINQSTENYNGFIKQMFTQLGRDSAQGVEIHAKASLVPAVNMRAYMRELLYFDATSALKDFKRPLLYVGSARSWPDTTSWQAVAKKRGYDAANGIRSHRVADSGYLIMSDQPDTLAAVISDFAAGAMAKR